MSDTVEQTISSGLSGQNLFCGEFTHVLDEKRRLTIPADWREMVGEPRRLFVIKAAHGKYLEVLPARTAAERMKDSSALLTDREALMRNKVLAARTALLPWDANGRVRLRDDMLAYAGITEKAGLISTYDGFQIWNEADAPFQHKVEPSDEEILAAMKVLKL